MIDIHAHIIPDIDDGASGESDALMMLKMAADAGTEAMVLTPHFLNERKCRPFCDKNYIMESFFRIKRLAAENGIKIKLYPGAEIFAVDNIEDAFADDMIITLNNSRYILTEFAFSDSVERALLYIEKLKSMGLIPVIAHPERYVFAENTPQPLYSFLEAGCLFQLNKGSIKGKFGRAPMSIARWLLDNGLAHIISSDCHSPFERTPDMSGEYLWCRKRYSEEYAEMLFHTNAEKIINNVKI